MNEGLTMNSVGQMSLFPTDIVYSFKVYSCSFRNTNLSKKTDVIYYPFYLLQSDDKLSLDTVFEKIG